MNSVLLGAAVTACVTLVGSAPIVAVYFGAADPPKAPPKCPDDTMTLPRIRAKIKPGAY